MTSPSERSQIRPEGAQTGADASALSSRQFPSLLALPEKPGTSQGRPEGGHAFLHSEHHGEHHGEDAARAVVTLIILPPLLVFYVWLTLCCADFLSLERSSFEADSAWQIFALHVALGCLLPPALIAGFTSLHTHDGHEPAPLDLLREGLRATLLCYGLFVVLFFSAAWMLGHFLRPSTLFMFHASGLCSGAALLSSALGVLEYCRLFVAPRHAAHAAAFRERLLCSGMDACSAGIILLAPISLCGRVGHTGRGTCSSSGLLPSGCLFLAAVQARTEKVCALFLPYSA